MWYDHVRCYVRDRTTDAQVSAAAAAAAEAAAAQARNQEEQVNCLSLSSVYLS
jgi:hypothetical protein